eukprot:TRINITY_DN5565_c0_g1_i2.p1 TRINITY_DN5565_c0_g1~~TRINITY_DN5565_c0_g1_i2.p1  ORF type:complete len:224 (-),score=40.76 TRINITY_DN5565_c0_g1_i2:92-706(-)
MCIRDRYMGMESKTELNIRSNIVIVRGDITSETTDAIVNAANYSLQLGSGVAGAIREKGGPSIQEECNQYVARHGRLKVGDVAVTGAGNLRVKWIFHTPGPFWEGGNNNEEQDLALCIDNILRKAEEKQLTSISIPAISTGAFNFPKDLCAKILISRTRMFFNEKNPRTLKVVRFVLFDEESYKDFNSISNNVKATSKCTCNLI